MSFKNTYLRFLSTPSEAGLAESAAFHYITSGSSLATPDAIIHYLNREPKLLKKRSEKVLSSVETPDTLVLEVETELEFVSSGGNYLPGMDDNFLSDQIVVFPIVHFVSFENNKIKQARLFWDQSTLLKQVGTIGKSGRNWPIKDGREQCQIISKSVAAAGSSSSTSRAPVGNMNPFGSVSAASSSTGESPRRGRRTSSNAMRDPHASLSLFEKADDEEEPIRPIAPRKNSEFRPPSRDLAAIIGPDGDNVAKPLPPKARSSFSKGQTFDLGALGEEEERRPTPKPVEKKKIIDPKKYQHFEFGDGEDASPEPEVVKAVQSKKNDASWNFEDFATPEKKPIRERRDDVRNFTWGDDETPQPKKPLANVGNTMHNKNFGSKFEISDESPAGSAQKKKQNKDDFYGEDEGDFFAGMGGEVKSRGIRIAGNGQGTRSQSESHWEHQYNSPEPVKETRAAGSGQGTRQQTDSHWEHQYNSPEPVKQTRAAGSGQGTRQQTDSHWEHQYGSEITTPGIRIAGNGQGTRKQTDSPWEHQYGSEIETPGIRIAGNGQGTRKQIESHWEQQSDNPKPAKETKAARDDQDTQKESDSPWDYQFGGEVQTRGIRIAGNGQGTRKQTDSHWEHEYNSPEPLKKTRAVGNGQGTRERTDSHWEHQYNSQKPAKETKATGDGQDTQKESDSPWDYQFGSEVQPRGIRIAGNGQGTRKQTESHREHEN